MEKETLSTSEKEVPKLRNALTDKYKSGEREPLNPENIQKQKEQLPDPSGWRLLVLPFEKYPTGPWCKKGDWVIFARYAGSRLPIEGCEVRLLNDDEVLGKIDNPESVLHNI